MGAVKKFNENAITNQLRHVERSIKNPKNKDIDFERTHLNYSLTPHRELTPKQYFKRRLSEVYVRNDKSMNLLAGWVVTLPEDLDEVWEKDFFEAVYEFLAERYGGEKNVISAEVHKDESGQPHMHFCFIPIAEHKPNQTMIRVMEYFKEFPESNITHAANALKLDRKTVRTYKKCTEDDIKYEKVCAKAVITKRDLTTFHEDLQSHLNLKGIPAKVKTGITKKNGGNKTVEELKAIRDVIEDINMEFEL